MEAEDLIALFPNLYKQTVPSVIPDFLSQVSPSRSIPRRLHFIWMGSPLPEEFWQNLTHFGEQMQELGGLCILWTDQKKIGFDAEAHGFHVASIDACFGNVEAMPTFYPFKAALAKLPPNFGEASDLLRLEVVDRFGGYYLDCDVVPEQLDLKALVDKGENPPFGLVWKQALCFRNDAFGAIPGALFLQNLRRNTLKNYKTEVWKENKNWDRGAGGVRYLVHMTVKTTGPAVFQESIQLTIDQLLENLEIGEEKKKEWIDNSLLLSPPYNTKETWVFSRTKPKPMGFKNEKERWERILHDLILHLIYEDNMLDLEKYHFYLREGEAEKLVSYVRELLSTHPALFQNVNRIFVADVKTYTDLQRLLEAELGKKIEWDELAALKVACLLELEPLVQFLVDKRGVNPLDERATDVAYYDCSSALPIAIALETGNIEIIQTLLRAVKSQEEIKLVLMQKRPLNLFYAGWQTKDFTSIFSIPHYIIQYLEMTRFRKKVCGFLDEVEEMDEQIKRYLAVQQLIEPYGR